MLQNFHRAISVYDEQSSGIIEYRKFLPEAGGWIQIDCHLQEAITTLLLPAINSFRKPYNAEQVHLWLSDFKSWGRFILESSCRSRTIFMDILSDEEIRICFSPHDHEKIDETIREHAFVASLRSLPTKLQAEIQDFIPIEVPAEIITSCQPRIRHEQRYTLFRDDSTQFFFPYWK